MNKKIVYSLLTLSVLILGCEKTNLPSNSDSSSLQENSSNSISANSSLAGSNSSTSDVSANENYEKIDDASSLFMTYSSNEEYDFMVKYHCDTIANREYQTSWETDYMFDGVNLQLTYQSNDGIYYTDYFLYDETTQQMIYYLDSGNSSYSYIDIENEAYFQFTSLIDYFELDEIEWEDDMIFDLQNHKCIPVNDLAKDRIGRSIFGDNPNEYWHKIEISWEDGYISHIDAISIHREVTYYYTIDLTEHGYVKGSITAPENVNKYTNPNQPYLKDKEEYTGVALTQAQADALTIFNSEYSMNYSADIRWSMVQNGVLYPNSYIDFSIEAEKGNYKYSYADSEIPALIHEFYLLSGASSTYPVCFMDEDFDGTFTPISYGMDEYQSYVSQIYLDRVLFYNLNVEDFIYDETKGYITAKNAALEASYCNSLFYFTDIYGGLRIYLDENEDGTYTLSKIETSMFMTLENNSAYSFVKTYNFTKINETSITYPEGVTI